MAGLVIRNFADAVGGVFYNAGVPYDSTGALLTEGLFTGDNPVTGRTAAGNEGFTLTTRVAVPTAGAIYIPSVTTTSVNFILSSDGSTTYLRGSTTVSLVVNTTNLLLINATRCDIEVPTKISTGHTLAQLNALAASVGWRAYCTDALAPTFLGALVGGGAVVSPAFYNGTAWVAG